MNPTIQRYLPPALVFGAAAFFGWPPSAPLDLGDDVVRASSVRWRPGDLADPPLIEPVSDPFKEVLVLSQETIEAAKAAVEVIPSGPSADELRAGLSLDGFADMGGRTWAVVNGRPRLPGDVVSTDDTNRHPCQIVSIETDHIVVRCEETVTKIHPLPFGSRRQAAANQKSTDGPDSAAQSSNSTPDSGASPEISDIAPPPQA